MDATNGGSERLDSWKAIAAYLKRDVRTVRRWEDELGLPVRRLAGGRGRSVFAYAADIDAWLATNQPAQSTLPANDLPLEGASPTTVARRRYLVPVTVALIVAAGAAAWIAGRPSAPLSAVRLEMTDTAMFGVVNGRERWRRDFPGERIEVPSERQRHPADMLEREPQTIVAATAWHVSTRTEAVQSGRLFSLSPEGVLLRSFAFDDRLAFGGGEFVGPWGITDFRVDDGDAGRRIAVAAHHHEWWPSLVTVLDGLGRRRATFVNAGWIERVAWMAPDRLVVAGFSEALDGGMIALLDPATPRAQSPVASDSPFYCAACGDGKPVRYVVMPRSEINRATGAPFNRARLELGSGRIVVRTLEAMLDEHDAVDAVYEFTPSLELIRASLSERYWDMHLALEAEGRIQHSREACPERDGPSQVLIWDPDSGWTTVTR